MKNCVCFVFLLVILIVILLITIINNYFYIISINRKDIDNIMKCMKEWCFLIGRDRAKTGLQPK